MRSLNSYGKKSQVNGLGDFGLESRSSRRPLWTWLILLKLMLYYLWWRPQGLATGNVIANTWSEQNYPQFIGYMQVTHQWMQTSPKGKVDTSTTAAIRRRDSMILTFHFPQLARGQELHVKIPENSKYRSNFAVPGLPNFSIFFWTINYWYYTLL